MAAEAAGGHGALVDEHAFRVAVRGDGLVEFGDHVAGLEHGPGGEPASGRQPSSMLLRISTSWPSANGQWVMSACQHSLRRSAPTRRRDERGPFMRLRVRNPVPTARCDWIAQMPRDGFSAAAGVATGVRELLTRPAPSASGGGTGWRTSTPAVNPMDPPKQPTYSSFLDR